MDVGYVVPFIVGILIGCALILLGIVGYALLVAASEDDERWDRDE